jgi:hypothetical protein
MDDLERPWNDLAAATSAAVEAFATAEDVFLLFAAAVFALHQDTLRACAFDMAKVDTAKAGDPGQAGAIDAAQPTPLGGFSARIGLAMEALMAVERANGEILANPPDDDGSDIYRLEMLMARMRATAARLWLLTVQARAGGEGGAGLRLGVAGLWTRLQTVPREALEGRAPAFTGMYYDGVHCEPLDYPAWPLTP